MRDQARRLNSISSGICQQNTHFNMYARTSKPQEGFTYEESHAKCFKTTNSTTKLYRGAMYRGEVLRASSLIFCRVSTFIKKFLHKNQTQILLEYLYTKHNF